MILNLKLVNVKPDYCDYLRLFDKKVTYNMNEKETRPFVGVLFSINNFDYFAPLSSPKPKHLKMKNTIDFFRIDYGKLGAINFNNMIPVKSENYEIIDLNKVPHRISDKKYIELLKDQLNWLNENYIQIKNKSFKLYSLYNNDKLGLNIKKRCCNFKMLEEKCNEYNKISVM